MVKRTAAAQTQPTVWPPPAPIGYNLTKRAMDVVIAGIVLAGASPLWLLIAAAIRLSSPGPALFKRPVAGKDGRVFTYYKFRSMRVGDDSRHQEWLREFVKADKPYARTKGQPIYKAVNDPRVASPPAGLSR